MAENIYCRINGESFDVGVAIGNYKRKFEVLHGENAGRSEVAGNMILDPIGTYLGREITFFRKGNSAEAVQAFDRLWDFLVLHSVDEDGVFLEAADGQGTIAMQVYYSSSAQDIEGVVNSVRYWGPFTVNFIPMEAQVTP